MSKARFLADLLESDGEVKASKVDAHSARKGSVGRTDLGIANQEQLTVDGSGNLTVTGTATVSSNLYATSKDFRLGVWDSNKIKLVNYEAAGTTDLRLSTRYANPIVFEVSDSERMRIDTSGNVIIGGTSAGAVSSVTTSQEGYIWARNTSTTGYFDRLSTDGSVIEFRKDGTAQGNIGLYDAGYLYIASTRTTDAGLKLGTSRVMPSTTSGADRDAAIDLGKTDVRFKDLHLSGTANALGLNIAGGGKIGFSIADSFTMNGYNNAHYGISKNSAGAAHVGVSGYYGLAFATQGSEKMRIEQNGNVGIGTSLPAEDLHIEKSHTGEVTLLIKNSEGTGNTTSATALRLSPGNLSSNASAPAVIGYRTSDFSSTPLRNCGLKFQVTNGNSGQIAMAMLHNGRVGIGTTSPVATLQVNGAFITEHSKTYQVQRTHTSTTINLLVSDHTQGQSSGRWFTVKGSYCGPGNAGNSGVREFTLRAYSGDAGAYSFNILASSNVTTGSVSGSMPTLSWSGSGGSRTLVLNCPNWQGSAGVVEYGGYFSHPYVTWV